MGLVGFIDVRVCRVWGFGMKVFGFQWKSELSHDSFGNCSSAAPV